MGFELSDIEDMCNEGLRPRSVDQISTVRIRKAMKIKEVECRIIEDKLDCQVNYKPSEKLLVIQDGDDMVLPNDLNPSDYTVYLKTWGCSHNNSDSEYMAGLLANHGFKVTKSIVDRITHVCEYENVKEIWLTSEDLGAWGIDLGHTIPDLLEAVVKALPNNCVLRLGMTNPPYILDHLDEISRILSHPNVYEFLHIPVQSGSDSVLLEMKREYSRSQFERICDFMLERHPNITIATDIICGYPTETDEDFKSTYELVDKYKFPVLFINQFYPRPGTKAAKLKRIPTHIVKARTRVLNDLFLSYSNIDKRVVGTTQRVLLTEIAHDGVKFVGHNKYYQQVLIHPKYITRNILGQWVDIQIESFGKFSMVGGRVKHKNLSPLQIIIAITLVISLFLFFT